MPVPAGQVGTFVPPSVMQVTRNVRDIRGQLLYGPACIAPVLWSLVANHRGEIRRTLEALLPQARREQWTIVHLAEVLGTTPKNAQRIIGDLRRDAVEAGEPDPWPGEANGLRRETYVNELLSVSGVRHPANVQDTTLRKLRQLSRMEQGLSFTHHEGVLRNFKARLLESGEVIDLRREDGDGYRRGDVWQRPGRPGEEGRIIAGE